MIGKSMEARLVESAADRADHSVHHSRGGDHVRARAGVALGNCLDQEFERFVVVDVGPSALSSVKGPQCPWDVYSQKQRSVITQEISATFAGWRRIAS